MVGGVDRMRRPGRAAIDAVAAPGTIGREEAGYALAPGALNRVSLLDQSTVRVWPGVHRPGHDEPVGVGSAVLSSQQERIEHEVDKRKRAVPISCICPGLYRMQDQNVSTRSYRVAYGRRGNCLLC